VKILIIDLHIMNAHNLLLILNIDNLEIDNLEISDQISILFSYYVIFYLGLNIFLVPINISTFRFSLSKIFLQLLLSIKFSITVFGPYL